MNEKIKPSCGEVINKKRNITKKIAVSGIIFLIITSKIRPNVPSRTIRIGIR